MNKLIPKGQTIQVLNVGTRILIKDVMDQYLRSLGDVKTFYASKMSSAVDSYLEKQPNIIFCEQTFQEGGALEFMEYVGGLSFSGDHYFVLAVEASSDELVALAMEKGIDEILVKPFATDNIRQIVERCLDKRAANESAWVKDLRTAKKSFLEKRYNEAEELYANITKSYWANSSVIIECAEFFVLRGQPGKAIPILEKVLNESPENVRALHLIGTAFRKSGRLKEAADKYLKANKLSPLNSVRNCDLAETYVALAEEQVQAALKIEEESSGLFLRKAQYMLLRKDYAAMVIYLDAKRTYLSELGRKEADAYVALAKKLGGIK